MARLIQSLLCIICALVVLPQSSYPATDQPLGTFDPSASQSGLQVSRTSPYYTSISLNSPNIVLQDLTINFADYQVAGISGEPFVMQDGSPAVPQVTRFYRIPNTGTAHLEIRESGFEVIENFNAMPLQYEASQFGDLKRNESVYGKQDWYPRELATISEPMILRDFRVVRVTLHPVQVNPVTKQARVYHNLSVDIVTTDETGSNELTNPRRPSYFFNPVYRMLIANLDEYALDDSTTLPGSYLILCKDHVNARPWADSLALWKKRQGFNTVVQSDTGWTVLSMINFIRSAYANWPSPPEFVCLIGDPESSFGVPTQGDDWVGGNFDHPFALGNLGDDLEDMGIGRLCGASITEMAVINAKTMRYERNPWMQTSQGVADTNWFHKGFFYCSTGANIISNWILMQWGARQFEQFTGVTDITTAHDNGIVDDDLVRNQIDGGVGFFIWRGSLINEMMPSLAPTCAASWRLPITLTVTCGAGNFVGIENHPCISESWLVSGSPSQPKGGVCGIGSATTVTHAPQNVCFAGGLMYSIANGGVETIGQAVGAAKAWLYATFSDGTEATFSRLNNLLGEPSLSMWTDVPVIMNASYPATINGGTRSMQVIVTRASDALPIQNALVVLWKGNETYSRGLTNANGRVDLPVMIESPGDLLLTVCKRNHKPFLATVPYGTSGQMVSTCRYTLDDDNLAGTTGNGNGLANPGETIDLPIYLKNFGTSITGTGVTATMTSLNSRVSVIQPTATYPNLAPGDSALGNVSFRIGIAPAMDNEESAFLSLDITASTIHTNALIEVICHAGEVIYISSSLDTALNPGTTRHLGLTIKNTGVVNLPGVTAYLVSLSPLVTVGSPNANFGDIISGQQVNNNSNTFELTADPSAYRGHVFPLMLIASSTSGAVDTIQFTQTVGTAGPADPTGPDGFGYYAYDNTDLAYTTHPDFVYENISAGSGTNLSLADSGDTHSIDNITSAVCALPFSFSYYGMVYDTITICSNGWMAFGNHAYHDGWRNYPIPSMQAPNSMIAPYFDDLKTIGTGHGVWTYFDAATHRFIVQWKATGSIQQAELDFEVILYDTAFHHTVSGNGKILFQYQTVTMNLQGLNQDASGCSVGIQDFRATTGLPIAYRDAYTAGSASIVNGRAILFTTDPFELSVDDDPSHGTLPAVYALHQNYPNPFNPVTEIRYDLKAAGQTSLTVYNLMGQAVASLVNERQSAGVHSVTFDGSAFGSGVYFCRMECNDFIQTTKMILMK